MRSLKKVCGVSFPDVLSVASREYGVGGAWHAA